MFDFILGLAIRLASAVVMLGWLLSALGKLTLQGCLIAGIPVILLIAIFSRRELGRAGFHLPGRRLVLWWKRRRLLPMIFGFTFLLIVCGSILHEPNNFDGLSYRIPKILYWTQNHSWQWIDTPFGELNYTLPNYEWLTLPCFLVTGGFHATVMINWAAFLLLPALFFSLLRTFGVSARLAYDWMWVFPSGYLIAMLAGGIGNDLVGLTAILAALHCAGRYAATGKKSYLFDALLAAGFCTGVKLSNLPLPGFVLIVLGLPALRVKPVALAGPLALGLLVSAFIPLLLNLKHTGTVLGTTSQADQVRSPIAGCLGNGLISLVTTLAPPVFPGANQVSGAMEKALGQGLDSWLRARYTKFSLRLNELPQEETGGLGLGITMVLIFNIALWCRCVKARGYPARKSRLLPWQKMAWWTWLGFCCLVLSARLGTGPAFPRNMLPWTPLLLAPVIAFFDHGGICRIKAWRIATALAALSVLPALILTPSRPMVRAAPLFELAAKLGAPVQALERARVVYEVYARRDDPFAPLKSELPENVGILGLVSDGNEPTASWWKPYGRRRCVYLLSEDAVNSARKVGVRYVVIQEPACRTYFDTDPAGWMQTHQARPVASRDVKLLAAVPSFNYTLARFESGLESETAPGEPPGAGEKQPLRER
jgi:hypothetical protein